MTINQIKKDGYNVAGKIILMPKIDSTFESTKILGKFVIEFSKIFQKLKPDINVVLGDRDEMFASAIAAYHMNIPNAHIHGGDKSGGLDEYTRHAITKLSNIHFAATKKSVNRILKMGENFNTVFHTGSPSIDEVKKNKISTMSELTKKYGHEVINNEILLLQHSVTTEIDKTEQHIIETLNAIIKLEKNKLRLSKNAKRIIITIHLLYCFKKYLI